MGEETLLARASSMEMFRGGGGGRVGRGEGVGGSCGMLAEVEALSSGVEEVGKSRKGRKASEISGEGEVWIGDVDGVEGVGGVEELGRVGGVEEVGELERVGVPLRDTGETAALKVLSDNEIWSSTLGALLYWLRSSGSIGTFWFSMVRTISPATAHLRVSHAALKKDYINQRKEELEKKRGEKAVSWIHETKLSAFWRWA